MPASKRAGAHFGRGAGHRRRAPRWSPAARTATSSARRRRGPPPDPRFPTNAGTRNPSPRDRSEVPPISRAGLA